MGEKEKKSSTTVAPKASASVVPALIIGIVGLGIGIAIGMFLPKNDGSYNSDKLKCEEAAEEKTVVREAVTDEYLLSEVDDKIDAYEMSGDYAVSSKLDLRSFHWKQLSAERRMHIVMTYLRNSDLADFVAAQKSWQGGDSITKTISKDRVAEVYKQIFGEAPNEEDFVSYSICSELTGKFDYDAEKGMYLISYYSLNCKDKDTMTPSKRISYEKANDIVYVTVENGSEKYQYIFDKTESDWVLRGLYPLGIE